MALAPDLISLLELSNTQNPLRGHQSIVIAGSDLNNADFAFNALLQHFCRRDPIPTYLVTLHKNWDNYSSCAAKSGLNVRRISNGGNVEILDVMTQHLESNLSGTPINHPYALVMEPITKFIDHHSTPNADCNQQQTEPPAPKDKKSSSLVIMIDDLGCLVNIGFSYSQILKLYDEINSLLRERSAKKEDASSYLVVQSHFNDDLNDYDDSDTYSLVKLITNSCDIFLEISPLSTGYSRQTDGLIKINDYRRFYSQQYDNPSQEKTVIEQEQLDKVISLPPTKIFHFKLGDRRTKLLSQVVLA